MKRFHYIKFRILVKNTDDYDSIISIMQDMLGVNFVKEKIKIEVNVVELENDETMKVVELFLKKTFNTNAFLKLFLDNISSVDRKTIFDEIDIRVDEDCDFFIRLDWNSFFDDKKYVLTSSGNCVHIKFSIATYPKKRDIALSIMRDIFKSVQISKTI